jgi:hypothetical protein
MVSKKHEILKPALPERKSSLFTPLIVFIVLFLVIFVLGFLKNTGKFLSVFDFILFFISGILGVFILFMWFGTDHPECKDNFNLAWAYAFSFYNYLFSVREMEPGN